MKIEDFFAQHTKVALAFSGGSDSAYLLYEAFNCRVDVRAYFLKTEFQPRSELIDARRLATDLGIPLTVIDASVLDDEKIAENTPLRCYFCKWRMFTLLIDRAAADGYDVVIDGTNASDDLTDRPGVRALAQLKVLSPLRECGITKEELRQRSMRVGLFTHNKPSYSCLATRIPTGTHIKPELLTKIELAEDALFQMGFSDLRLRIDGDTARLELPVEQLQAAIEKRENILAELEGQFKYISLDLRGR